MEKVSAVPIALDLLSLLLVKRKQAVAGFSQTQKYI